MFDFFKKLFTIPGVSFPGIKAKMPDLDVEMKTPRFMGWSADLRMYWPKLSIPGVSLLVGIVAGIEGLAIAGGTYYFSAK